MVEHPGEKGPLHKRLVQAIADPGHWLPRGDDYTESIPSWSARAVVAALDLRECCCVCGMNEADCTGQDHGEYAHDYGPLTYVAAQFGRSGGPDGG